MGVFFVKKSQGGSYIAQFDLRRMTAADVIRQAIIISGKTQEQIEEEAGLRPGSLDQYASRRDHHWPSLINLPGLSMALGTDLLIRWQEEQLMGKCLEHTAESMPPDELLREIVTAAAEFGDVARAADKAIKDQQIDRTEAMGIRREAMEVVARMYKIINGVAARV